MSKYMESLLLVQNSVGCAAGVCSVNQVVPSIDSSGEMAGRRTSVLVIFEERILLFELINVDILKVYKYRKISVMNPYVSSHSFNSNIWDNWWNGFA